MAETPSSVLQSSSANDVVEDVFVRPSTPIASIVVAIVGALLAAAAGAQNPLVIGLLGLAALIMLLSVPAETVRGVSAALSLAVAFSLAPNNATRGTIYIGVYVALAIIVVGLVRGRHMQKQKGLRPTALILGITYLAVLFFSTLFSAVASDPMEQLLLTVAPGLGMIILGRRFTKDDMRVFCRGFVAFAMLQVVVAIIDFLGVPIPFLGYSIFAGDRLYNSLLGNSVPREQALAGHPIIFALILIIAVVMLWRNEVHASTIVRLTLFVALAVGLILSGTRSAILAMVVGVLFLAVVNARSTGARLRNIAFIIVAGAIGLTNSTLAGYVAGIISGLGDSGSYSHRAGAFESVTPLVTGEPTANLLFGLGAGSEPSLFARGLLQQDGFNIIDNQFVTSIVVVGFFGLALILAMMLRSAIWGNPFVRALMLMLMVMMNSFDMLRWVAPAMSFFLVIGFVDNPLFRSRFVASEAVPDSASLLPPQETTSRMGGF
ncbi:O-antigen ligase family protein [Subtercola vilae]|uniref:O-antigen ligase domain-containing protein n=1 Tax=Subtercola vilae TaxID=2056433 RepID=A0A4T2BUY0_9MICO|nr:O-antigen ligase family protein [Subtercola vilae]TIH35583.1 hypothetical protein D4765_11000 [Subtercola vilae]